MTSEPGGLENQTLPKRVDAFLTHFQDFVPIGSVSCGAYHTLALSRRGEVFSFGDGESGALGLADQGDAATHRAATPTLVATLHDIKRGDAVRRQRRMHRRVEKKERQRRARVERKKRERGLLRSGETDESGASFQDVLDLDEDENGEDDELDSFDADAFENDDEDDDSNEEEEDKDGDQHTLGGDDGSGYGTIASVCAGHLTSAAVDTKGRLWTWGCAYGEDGVQPTQEELLPRRTILDTETTAHAGGGNDTSFTSSLAEEDEEEGEDEQEEELRLKPNAGGVKFRCVEMGGYHTVALSQVHDRWGRPFDHQFSGLAKGLQLPTAKHRDEKQAKQQQAEWEAEAAEQEAAAVALLREKEGAENRGGATARRKALEAAAKKAEKEKHGGSIGKLMVAPRALSFGGGGGGGLYNTDNNGHQSSIVAQPILTGRRNK
mmetsp:Transcript_12049/g.24416  ORF Transcript_12049/g.24416 Transcript_12049/m.24416 type:complete len:435 (+) Transcript_12049:1017-2321(+)